MKGSPLAQAFEQTEGSLAIVWGQGDIVSLAKEVVAIAEDKKMAPFEARGGVVDGQRIGAVEVKDVSKWPSREEVLGKIVGQILGPGANLAALLLGPGGKLAGQLKTKSEGAEDSSTESLPRRRPLSFTSSPPAGCGRPSGGFYPIGAES